MTDKTRIRRRPFDGLTALRRGSWTAIEGDAETQKKTQTLEESRPLSIALGWACAAFGLWLFLAIKTLQAVPADFPDALDYGQVARNLLRDHGFTTNFILPLSLARFDGLAQAELMHPPVTSLLMALSFKLFGENARSLALPSGLAFAALAGLACLLVSRSPRFSFRFLLPFFLLLSQFTIDSLLFQSSGLFLCIIEPNHRGFDDFFFR